AGRYDKGSRGRLHHRGQPAVESVPEGLPQTLYRAHRVVDELICGSIQDDAFHCIGRSGAVAADWLWKRGELIARASNHPRERVRDTLGAWSEPLAIDSSTAGGKHDPGDGRRGGGHVVSMGRIEVFSGADAAEYYPRRSSDPPEHTSAVVHFRSSRTDGGCVWPYSGIESSAERCERTAARQRQGCQRGIPPWAFARRRRRVGSGAISNAIGCCRIVDAEFCGAARREIGTPAGPCFGGQAPSARGPVQNGGASCGILSAALAEAEGPAGCNRSDRNEHSAALWRNPQRHRNSRQVAHRKMECDVSTLQRGIFPGAENSVRQRQAVYGRGSNRSAKAGRREPDFCEEVFGERQSHRATGSHCATGTI